MLRVIAALGGAAGGTGGLHILFTNKSGRACTVRGYPSVVGVDPAGHVLVPPPAHELSGYLGGIQGAGGPPLLTVGPGQTVSVMVQWSDDPTICGQPETPANVTRVRIAAPGGRPQTVHAFLGTCATEVSPLLGGTANFATVHDPPVTIRPCAALTVIPFVPKDAGVPQPLEVTVLDAEPQYCTLAGFPSVTALDAHGRVMATATDVGSPNRTFLLTGEQGSVLISWDATPGCRQSAALTLAAPGSSTVATMKVAVPICGLRVGAFRDTY